MSPEPRPWSSRRSRAKFADQTEIIITATKREENLQNVPISVHAIGTRRLDQLNISNFEDYTKQLAVGVIPHNPARPDDRLYAWRLSGGGTDAEGNHSGPLPQVGTYLDEQPVTTIGGTLDIHIYDIARIESLAGPQGTLYGASSEAGTIRIITNKPELGKTYGRVDGELNTRRPRQYRRQGRGHDQPCHREQHRFPGGGLLSTRCRLHRQRLRDRAPITTKQDRPMESDIPPTTVTNANLVKKNFNDQIIYGGRAALKIDLDDNWTATPTFMYQKTLRATVCSSTIRNSAT